MRPLFHDDLIAPIEEALFLAREELRRYWMTDLVRMPPTEEERWKSGQTRADLRCQDILLESFATLRFPFSFISEEGSTISQSPAVEFLIDPLDGTHNAYAGYPAYTCSVAAYVDAKPVFGCVYDISRDLLYKAAENRGAYLHNSFVVRRLHARRTGHLSEMAVSFLRARTDGHRRALSRILWDADKIRLSSCSSLDLCLIASGVLDAFVDISQPGHERSCDVAAAAIVLSEAGGVLLGPDGNERRLYPPSESALIDYGPLLACGSAETATGILDAINCSKEESNDTDRGHLRQAGDAELRHSL